MPKIKEQRHTIRCPECGTPTRTYDSRPVAKATRIWRRRECLNTECLMRMTTVELDREDFEKLLRKERLLSKVRTTLFPVLSADE
jgi:transcriptional regulator NrdR family protein